jgi:hypothetical protein
VRVELPPLEDYERDKSKVVPLAKAAQDEILVPICRERVG